MFFTRPDGRKLKKLHPITTLLPYILDRRVDSQIIYKKTYNCESFDNFISDEKDRKISYMAIIIAAVVRVFAQRPTLNRFIVNSRIYARDGIYICFVMHRTFRGDGDETTVKIRFRGDEDIYEVNEILENVIKREMKEENGADALSKALTSLPGFLTKIAIKLYKSLDRHNLMPKSVIDASPFHTSVFITNLKSINLEYAYHHLYEFGTNGMFIAIGREYHDMVIQKDGSVQNQKLLTLGLVADERICDGLYLTKSFRLLDKYLKSPGFLCEKLDKIVEDGAL